MNTITFTKGDASTFNIIVNTGSAVTTDITSLNAFTASQYVSNSYFATTASLNSYTQSTNIRLNNLETTSASVNVSISNLNSTTASQAVSITNLNAFTQSQDTKNSTLASVTSSLNTSASLSLYTASFNTGTRNLTFTKGDTSTFSVNIPDASGSAGDFVTTSSFNAYTQSNNQRVSSLEAATGSYATTGSNIFIGNQIITGSVTISGSATSDLTVVGQIFVSSSGTSGTTTPRITVSGSQGITRINKNSISTQNLSFSAAMSPLAIFCGNVNTLDEFGLSFDSGTFTNWSRGPAIYINDPLDTYPAVFGFQDKANYTDGRVTVLTPLSASAGFTASLQNGYAWVGNSLGQNTEVATSSFAGTTINTGSFATTGSNTFIGNQIITGSITSSNNIIINGVNIGKGPSNLQYNTIIGTDALSASTTSNYNVAVGFEALKNNISGNSNTAVGLQALLFNNTFNNTAIGNGAGAQIFDGSGNTIIGPYTGSTSLTDNIVLTNGSGIPKLQYDGTNWLATGSLFVSGNIYANNLTGSTINTGSFATTGSNTFTGNQNLTSSSIYLNGSGRIQMPNGAYFLGNPGDAFQLNSDSSTFTVGAGNFNLFNDGGGVINIKGRNNNGIDMSGSATYIQDVNFIPFSASLNTRILAVTGSSINTGSFATTGSNTFRGSQVISGSLIQSSSNSITGVGPAGQAVGTYIRNRVMIGGGDGTDDPTPRFWISGSDGAYNEQGRGYTIMDTTKGTAGPAYLQMYANELNNAAIYMGVYNPNDGSGDTEFIVNVDSGSGTTFQDWDNNIGGYSTWLNVPFNNGTATPTFKRGLNITGSLYVSSSTQKDVIVEGQLWISSSNLFASGATTQPQLNIAGASSGTLYGSRTGSTLIRPAGLVLTRGNTNSELLAGGLSSNGPDLTNTLFSSNTAQYTLIATDSNTIDNEINLYVDLSGAQFRDYDANIGDYSTWLSLGPNDGMTIPIPTFTRGLAAQGPVLFTTGSNNQAGTAVLNGANPGTVTVSNSLVTANSIILLTKQTLTNAHMVAVSAKSGGSFTITSNGNGDADTVGWFVINNS